MAKAKMQLPTSVSPDLEILERGISYTKVRDVFGFVWNIRKPAQNMFYVDFGTDKKGEPNNVHSCYDLESALDFVIENADFEGYSEHSESTIESDRTIEIQDVYIGSDFRLKGESLRLVSWNPAKGFLVYSKVNGAKRFLSIPNTTEVELN